MGHPYSRSAKFLRQRRKSEMIDDGRLLRGIQVKGIAVESGQTPDQDSCEDISQDVQEEHREA